MNISTDAAIPVGATVSRCLITLPVWVQTMSVWAAVLSPIIGGIVGLLTAYLLCLKIMQRHRKDYEKKN